MYRAVNSWADHVEPKDGILLLSREDEDGAVTVSVVLALVAPPTAVFLRAEVLDTSLVEVAMGLEIFPLSPRDVVG